MVETHPTKIPGRWRDGYALDYHTISSIYLGDDEFGHPQFDTKRSDVGELLYRLKYRNDSTTVNQLVDAIVSFLTRWKPEVDVLIPIPPSRARTSQPVLVLAESLSKRLGLPYAPVCVTRCREVPELKNVYGFDERTRLLDGVHAVDRSQIEGRRVLLFDDLFRSGATMNSITTALYDNGCTKDVFALTITRTRSHQ